MRLPLFLLLSVYALLTGCALSTEEARAILPAGAEHVGREDEERIMLQCFEGDYVGRRLDSFPKEMRCTRQKDGTQLCEYTHFYSRRRFIGRDWSQITSLLYVNAGNVVTGCAAEEGRVVDLGVGGWSQPPVEKR